MINKVGLLVINSANAEGYFLGLLEAAWQDNDDRAAIAWASHRNTNARLDFALAALRRCNLSDELMAEIGDAAKVMKEQAPTRNFYVHGWWDLREEQEGPVIQSVSLDKKGAPLKTKSMDNVFEVFDELDNASEKFAKLTDKLRSLVQRVHEEKAAT